MSRCDPPALVGPYPSLTLPSGRRRACALEFDVRRGEVPPVGGDHRLYKIAGQIGGWPAAAKGGDLVGAIEILGRAVAQGVRALPEQRVEFGDVVGDKRTLV